MEARELISIGRIVGTHGYKGIIKVEPLTDFPQRFNNLHKVKMMQNSNTVELLVESCLPHKGLFLMKLDGIDNMEEARKYRNAHLVVNEDELYPLPEGSYYHFQLKGMAVYDMERGYLGELKDILETGANDVYVINSEKFGEILIPAIKEVIVEIDLDNKKMQVRLLPGLIDED